MKKKIKITCPASIAAVLERNRTNKPVFLILKKNTNCCGFG